MSLRLPKDLPEGWRFLPLKRVAALRFSGVDKHSLPDEEPVRLCNYVDVYKNEVITSRIAFMKATATRAEIERFSLCRGDVLMTKDSETPDDIGVPAFVAETIPGVLCGYHLAMLRSDQRHMSGAFLSYVLRADGVRQQFHVAAKGVTRFGLGQGDLGTATVIAPPLEVQGRIARFLDRRVTTIDALVAKKEKLVERLREKRQATITETVMRGLDPNVVMKDSGSRYMGQIPAHWRVCRLMHLTPDTRQIMYGIVLPGPHVAGGIPIVKSGDCHASRLKLERLHRTTPAIEAPFARARLRAGDIVYAIRGSVGAATIVPPEVEGANLTQDAARIAPAKGVNSRWLLYLVQSHAVWTQLEAGVLGATIKGINIRDLKRPYVPAPPSEEQGQIAQWLDQVTATIDATLAKTTRSIELLKEYRRALITEAVTGRLPIPLTPAEESHDAAESSRGSV